MKKSPSVPLFKRGKLVFKTPPFEKGRWGGILLCLFLAAPLHASEAQLKEGNRLFRAGKYAEALKKYNDALIDTPYSSVLKFNIGAAAYQSGDFGTGEKRFKEVADETPHPILKGAARYNQGNALFRQQKWKEAIEAYKESLRANPHDEDAKYNLGVAMNVMNNPSKPQPQSGSGKSALGKNDSKNKDKSNDMSKQDAERLLAAAGAGEKKKTTAQKAGAPHPDEDW
jgi:tetratricopeptide (TPR) repeat protein